MIRSAFVLTLSMGLIALIAAAVEASDATIAHETRAAANQTVIEKNSPFPVVGPITVEQCAVEDCSDVTS